MSRDLFVYWRCESAGAAAALAAVSQMQAVLRAQHPGLHARLYRRADEAVAGITVMETYGGVDAALQAGIEAAALKAMSRWCLGQRHSEVFDELPADPG